jgi:hypothetical protein
MHHNLSINCIVLGDNSSHVFTTEIDGTNNVSALKKAIKDEKRPVFDHVPADALKVYKVSFPVDDGLDTQLKRFQPEHDGVHRLSNAVERLKGVFGEPIDGNLHVIVLPPPACE